ncbi:hypothetical protein DL96DRAFT_1577308 [Flagelloscypha sp. PMI_526]|nr:hypothetical protein DL96DRAFT_1577308 [Flagelloscypha sp. PMI_526]
MKSRSAREHIDGHSFSSPSPLPSALIAPNYGLSSSLSAEFLSFADTKDVPYGGDLFSMLQAVGQTDQNFVPFLTGAAPYDQSPIGTSEQFIQNSGSHGNSQLTAQSVAKDDAPTRPSSPVDLAATMNLPHQLPIPPARSSGSLVEDPSDLAPAIEKEPYNALFDEFIVTDSVHASQPHCTSFEHFDTSPAQISPLTDQLFTPTLSPANPTVPLLDQSILFNLPSSFQQFFHQSSPSKSLPPVVAASSLIPYTFDNLPSSSTFKPSAVNKVAAKSRIVPLDAPTQPRSYRGDSVTSRKPIPPSYAKRKADSIIDEEEVSKRRRQNCESARKCRQKKRDQLDDLHAQIAAIAAERDQLRFERDYWKDQAENIHAYATRSGLPIAELERSSPL